MRLQIILLKECNKYFHNWGDKMNEQVLKDVKEVFKEMGFEVLKDEVISYLDIRSFDEVVDDNLCYWNVGDLPYDYIDTEAMVDGDNDYTQVGDMYWKNAFFEEDSEDEELIKMKLIKRINQQSKDNTKQQGIDWAITQAYIDLKESTNGFSKIDALLFIVGHDFGNTKLYFASDMKKVKRALLECFKELLELMNDSIDDGYVQLWLPNHNIYSNEEDDKYCQLIEFGGYKILEDGKMILESDAILLKNEESIHTLEYFTYQNMNQLCNYIGELFEFYKEDVFNVGDKEYEQQINQKLNQIIDCYWKDGKIDFDYAEFDKNH